MLLWQRLFTGTLGIAAIPHAHIHAIGGEESIGEFEESIGPTMEAFVEGLTKGGQSMESVGGLHNVPIMHSSRACRISSLPAGLKRKLRVPFKAAV